MQDGSGGLNKGIKDQILDTGGFPRTGIPRGDSNAQTLTPADSYDSMMNRLNNISDKNKLTLGASVPIMPSQVDTSGRFPKQILGGDNEELYAQGQSGISKFRNAFVKMLGTAGSTFLQGTIGLIDGATEWAGTGDMSKLWDNDVNRGLTSMTQDLENKLPNYYTHKEIDSKWYSGDNLFTANFWFDKVMKNLGFSLGAAAGGFAWGAAIRAIGLTSALARAGVNMENFASGMESTLAKTPQVERGTAALDYLSNGVKQFAAKSVGNILSKSDRIITAAMGTFGESSMEAIQNSNQFRDNAIDEYKKNHYNQEPTGADLDEINKAADHVGNWSFGLNSVLLTGTNYVQFPRLLNMSYKGERAMVNSVETQPLRQVGGKFISALPEKGLGKLLYKGKNIAGLFFNPTEGFEEGAQNVIQEGTQDFFGKAKKNENTSFWESLGVGVDRTINTKNGIEQILIGGLSGALQTSGLIPFHKVPAVNRVFGGESYIKERGFTGYGGDREKATQVALSALNKTNLASSIKDSVDSFNRSQVLQEERERAVRQGDVMEAKDKEFDFAHNYLYPRIKYDKSDFVKSDIEYYRQLASVPEGFDRLQREGYATAIDTPESFIQRLNNLQEHANTAKKLYENYNIKYGDKVDDKGAKLYTPDVIDKMVYAASKVSDYDKRIPALSSELLKNGISAQAAVDTIYKDGHPSEAATKEALEQINNLNTTKDVKDGLKQDLQDVLEMALRRRQFVKEHDKIQANPKNYKDVNYTPEEILQPTISLKQGEKEKTIAVGQEYSLKNPIIRDGNTLTPNPKVAVLSQTLAGEFEVKLPNGNRAFLTKQQLENYQLSDATADNEKINEILDKAIDKTLALAKYKDIVPPEGANKLEYINSLDNKELIDDILEEANKSYKEIVAKRIQAAKELEALKEKKEALDKLFKSQQNTSVNTGNVADINIEIKEEEEGEEGRKKAVHIVFSSTTSASEANEPDDKVPSRVVRERNFLFNHTFFPDAIRDSLKAVAITTSSEASLGLKGLVQSVYQDDPDANNYKIDDIDNGVVVVVYLADRNGFLHFVDENGKLIGEVGKTVDRNKIIVSTLPTTSTTWRDGKSRFRQQEQDQAEAVANQWREKRKTFFGSSNYTAFDFTVSRGLPVYDSFEEDGKAKYKENSPTSTLFDKKKAKQILLTQGVVVVADTEHIQHQGLDYKTKYGRIYFKFHDRFAPLNNRQFTEDEQNSLYKIIHQLAKEKGQAERLRNYLRNVLYFAAPTGKTIGRNQIWVDEAGMLNIGNNGVKFPFTPTSIEENEKILKTFLSGVYNNTNNQTLTKLHGEPFEEILDINADGTYVTRQWQNYQTFLLENEYDGKPRNSYLKTPIRPVSPVIPNDRNFQQKYAILQGLEYQVRGSEEEEVNKQIAELTTPKAPVVPKKVVAPELKTFTTSKGETLSYAVDATGVHLSNTGDYSKAIARVSQLDPVKEAIAKGTPAEDAARVFLETAIQGRLSQPEVKKVNKKSEIWKDDEGRYFRLDYPDDGSNVMVYAVDDENGTAPVQISDYKAEVNPSAYIHNGKKVRDIILGKKEVPKVEIKTPIPTPQAPILTKEQELAKYLEPTEYFATQLKKGRKEYIIVQGEKGLTKVAGIPLGEHLGYNWMIIENVNGGYMLYEESTGIGAPYSTTTQKDMKEGWKAYLNEKGKETLDKAINSSRSILRDINRKYEEKPSTTETVPKETPKNLSTPQDNEPEFREFSYVPYERMGQLEKKEFSKFISDKLPQFTVQEVDHLLTITGNRRAWGKLQGDVITLYKAAEKGTGYHEAFEGVWKYFLDAKQQADVNKEFKDRKGTFKDRGTQLELPYGDATDHQIKEELADEFADYKTGKKLSIGEQIRAFFNRIIKFFRTFLRGYKENVSLVDQLFQKIEKGEFKEYKLPQYFDNTQEFAAVPSLTVAQTNGYVQDISARFMFELLREKADLFEPKVYERADIFTTIKSQYQGTIASFPEGEETFNKLVTKVKEHLATYKIEFDENNEVSINDDDVDRVSYDSSTQKMRMDIRKSQPFAVKLLIGTLYKTKANVDNVGNIIGDPIKDKGIVDNYQLLAPSKTTITLLQALAGSTSIDDMINKLRVLANDDSDYIRLINRLGKRNEGGGIDFDSLTTSQWRMMAGFYNSFNRQKPEVKGIVYENGEAYFRPMDIGSSQRQLFNSWENNIRYNARYGKGPFQGYDRGSKLYKVDKAKLAEYKKNIVPGKSTVDAQLAFLNDLGVTIDKGTYNKLTAAEKDSMANAINKIFEYLNDQGGLKIVEARAVGISRPLTIISSLYAKAAKPDAESTFINGDGEQQQTYVQTNYVSYIQDVFNSVTTKEELLSKMPNLRDVYSDNSEILKEGGRFFDEEGNRTGAQLVIGYMNASENRNRNKSLKDIDYVERLETQLNNILDDRFYISVPADGSTDWYIGMPGFIGYTELLSGSKRVYDKMYDYLSDEANLAIEDRWNVTNIGSKSKELRFFKDILSERNIKDVNKAIEAQSAIVVDRPSVDADFQDYINKEKAALKKTLIDENIIYEDTDSTVRWPNLLDAYVEKYSLPKNKTFTGEQFNNILSQIVINDFVANTELHKFLFGDPYNFKVKADALDETKRIKSFLSPAQPSLVSTSYNNAFAKEWANTGTITDYTPKNVISTSTIKDVIIDGKLPGYQNTNEADSQAIHSILFHRDLLSRHYKLSDEANKWMDYELAYTRSKLAARGIDIGEYTDEQKKVDEKLLEKPRPPYTMAVIKPIVRGMKWGVESNNAILDKISSAPIWFSAVEGKNLEKLFIKMLKEKIDYVVLESGRKVGAEGVHSMYNPDGSFNTLPFNNKIDIGWENYSIQVENQYDPSGRQTRGSQLTKLFSLDFFEEGKPIDFEEGKESEIEKMKNENNKILDALTIDGYNRLLDKLGVEDDGEAFHVVDREKLMDTLRRESFKRDMPDNVRDVFKPNKDGEYEIPFEATSEYTKIQKMLYAMADNNIISPTHNGGQKTQLSVIGWENANQGRKLAIKTKDEYKDVSREEYAAMSKEDKDRVVLTSSALKFYTEDDRYMEILLPNFLRRKLDPKDKRTDEELLSYLNSTKEGQRILRGIGFRIPTQGMNQAEAFRVKGFLAAEYGDTVVVPSEITTKAGSDFDIDKLNTYLRNVYLDNKGDIKEVPFFGFGEEGKAALKKWLNEGVLEEFLLDEKSPDEDAFDKVDFKKEEEKAKRRFESLYTQSLENAYIDNLEWFITHPLNFTKLTQPTEGGPLKAISTELAGLLGQKTEVKISNILSINYLSKLRQQFMSAKKWIGIAVHGVTSHSQAQRTQLYLDVASTPLNKKDKEILGDGKILLEHNTTTVDGRVLPSLSKLLDQADKFISDKLSWYTTAMVDVAKDPYITTIIHNKKIVAAFIFLERIGVPTRTVALFMNQPIVREYLKFADNPTGDLNPFSKLTNPYYRDEFLRLGKFPNSKGDSKMNVGEFTKNIEDYYKSDKEPRERLTAQQNRDQNLIFKEFLKYFKMSEHLFNFTQATNWDTADLKTGGSIYKKQLKTQREDRFNIFKTPSRILNSTGLATIASSMGATREAVGTLSKFDSPLVRNELDEILKPYATLEGFQDQGDFEKIDSQIVSSFIDFLIQTKTGLNTVIRKIVVDKDVSTAERIVNIKKDQVSLDQLNKNPIFQTLQAQIKEEENGVNNLILRPFPKLSYDKDLITGYLREIKELDPDLYGALVRLALLQGTGKLNNLLPYIPYEEFAKALSPLIQGNLQEDANSYKKNHNFERANWKNNSVVPEATRLRMYFSQTTGFKSARIHSTVAKVIKLTDTYNADLVQYPIIKVRRTIPIRGLGHASRWDVVDRQVIPASELEERKKQNDYSFLHHAGFQKVLLANGDPLITTDKEGTVTYYYKQINLTGTKDLQEHYTDGRPSILDNQTVKLDHPKDDDEIVRSILGPKTPLPPIASEDENKNITPEEGTEGKC